jgi:DNA-directed RNA polymerase specialized sigma24 family protein
MNPWQQQATAHWELINRLAGRRFRQQEIAEEAALFVMDGLSRDDWRRLRSFGEQSSWQTFIAALTLRLLEDFSRHRFGRMQPPLWVRRLGGIWTTLFRLLCLERYSPSEAAQMVGDRYPGQVQTAEEAAYRLLGEIPNCGERRSEQTELDENTTPATNEEDCSVQEQHLEEQERTQMLAALGRILFDGTDHETAPRLMQRLMDNPLSLEAKERLLLQLCYRDGVGVTEAGRMLGWNRHQVHGRLRRLLVRLRQQVAEAGVEDELRLLL